ncbi:MAG: DnaJ domain-containing protein [Bacteroidetes bacterium]|nr:DnaJ domain-containing protein [Bacteroidota bacterium]
MSNYYQILGVSQEATIDEIRKAYRIRAKLFHPDINKNENSKLKFQIINEAYQTLIDPQKRKWYDFKLKYGTTRVIPQKETPKQRDARRSSIRNQYSREYDFKYAQARRKEREEAKYVKTLVDKVLFYIMMLFGILACFFGTTHLIFDRWEGLKDLTGVLFGVSFLFLLIYGWRAMEKP